MIHGKTTIDAVSVVNATSKAIRYGEDVAKNAVNFLNDPKKKERIEKGECKSCFYLFGKIGGQAITSKPCGICEETITFSNTCTGVVCKPCGEKHKLCNHCGADMLLRPRRTFNKDDK